MKKGCLISFLILMGIGIVATCVSESNEETISEVSNDSTSTVNANAKDKVEEDENGWKYRSQIDEMTSAETKFATITSTNYVEFDFPYEGESYLTLTIRKSQKHGLQAYIRITKGQFIASQYTGTNNISIRFDDEQPVKFYTSEPADASTDLLFINNASKLIKKAQTAKTIKIEVAFYQEGNRVFTFKSNEPLNEEKL